MQSNLFTTDAYGDVTMSHAHDPETSKQAAQLHLKTGRRIVNAGIVYGLVNRFPRSTAIELWTNASANEQATLKEPQEVRRRLTDLLRWGRVQQGDARPCKVRGTRQVTWIPEENPS